MGPFKWFRQAIHLISEESTDLFELNDGLVSVRSSTRGSQACHGVGFLFHLCDGILACILTLKYLLNYVLRVVLATFANHNGILYENTRTAAHPS